MKIRRIDFVRKPDFFTFLAALFFAKGFPPFAYSAHTACGGTKGAPIPAVPAWGKAPYKMQTACVYFFNSSKATSIAEKKL
jgi:hypothetical protein